MKEPDQPKATVQMRDVIFLSYGMPEETAFAVWLGTQLANNGYRVWSEATRLIGGEQFWNDIEDVFASSVGRTIVVVSKSTKTRDGVRNEIERAIATSKSIGVDPGRFIIPVALEDVPRTELPIEIARHNAIPFWESWADGLAKLLKALQQVKFPQTALSDAVGHWVRNWYEGKHGVVHRPEILMNNALPIASLPSAVRFFRLETEASRFDDVFASLPFPRFRFYRLIGTFADLDEIQSALPPGISAVFRAELSLEDFLAGRGDPQVGRREAKNHLSNMLRQAWDRYCAAIGMSKLELSSGHACWFFRTGSIDSSRVKFLDPGRAKARSKALYGVKTRKNDAGVRVPVLHWHFAPHAFFSLGNESQLILEPHVAFTADGKALVGDAAKCHRIRRSFCRSWFNEQWRTLHLAYVMAVTRDQTGLIIPLSADQSVSISIEPTLFASTATFVAPPKKGAMEDEVVSDEDDSGDGGLGENSIDPEEFDDEELE